jgi:hypothetical protein
MAGDPIMIWLDAIESLSKLGDPESAKTGLHSAILRFREIPSRDLHRWVATSMSTFLSKASHLFGLYIEISLSEFSLWLLEDRESHLDGFIDFLAVALESERRIDFVIVFAFLVPQLLTGSDPIDLNFLLAIQSPVFSYCVSHHPDSEEVCERWFHALAGSRGAEIFREDRQSALSYFKMMNHAFLQVSITTATALIQDPVLIAAQDAMHDAIIAISQIVNP